MRFPFSKLYYGCLIALLGMSNFVKGEEVEFDERFLGIAQGQPQIDVSRYSKGNPIPTGKYRANVYVNGELQGNINIWVEENAEDPIQGICLTPALSELLSLKSNAFALAPAEKKCVSLVQGIPEGKFQFDMGSLSLNLEIPQLFVQKRPRGYISPSLWQSSNPVLFVRYNASHSINRSHHQRSDYRYVNLQAGINLDRWSIRHSGSKSWLQQESRPYLYQYTYLQQDIDWLRGRMTLGDFSTSSSFFGALNIRGIEFASDDRMRPSSERGYAPAIEGVANSNAKVVIRQNENILYETTVPAGPFRIDDIYPSGYAGQLSVEITEADGRVHHFSVPFANGVRLLRKGQFRYKVAGGRLRQGTKLLEENVLQGEARYGLMNGLTLNVGVSNSRNYLSGVLGVAFDTPLGAFSSDLLYSQYQFPHLKRQQKKYALNVGYNTRLSQWGTYFSASYYRSFSPENYSLMDVLEINRNKSNLTISNPLQQRIVFSMSQSLAQGWGSLSLAGMRQQHWNSNNVGYEYQLNYSNSYKKLYYQIGYSQGKTTYSNHLDKRLSLNLSWQFGSGLTKPMLYSRYQKTNDSYSLQNTLSGSLGEDSNFNYSISSFHRPKQRQYAFNAGYRTSMAKINIGLSKSKYNQQTNLNLSGAIVAHSKGITLSNDLGDTFAIIHAKGATGAKINNSTGAYLDWFGNGIVPYVSPYYRNYVGIDPVKMKEDVEIEATGQEIIPRANSAILVKFNTKSGKVALFDVTLANGDVPPIAAEVFDQNDQHIGYVVQGGRIFVRGIAESGKLKVVWGSAEREKCQFSYKLLEDEKQANRVNCQ